MNNNTNTYFNTSKEVSLISFFEYFIKKKHTTAFIFFVITILGLLIILFGPASKKEYTITYEIYKSQSQKNYQFINADLEVVYNELLKLDVEFERFKLDSETLIRKFYQYLNNKIFLYNFFNEQFSHKISDFDDNKEYINFINSKVVSLKPIITEISTRSEENVEKFEVSKVSFNFITNDLENDTEILSKLLFIIDLQLKNDALDQLTSVKNLYNDALKQRKDILKNKLRIERNIYEMMLKKRLIFLNEQKLIAQYDEKFENKNNTITTSRDNLFEFSYDSVDLSLYYRKGVNVIEKEIEVLQSRENDYIPYSMNKELNELIRIENKDDRIISDSIDLFNAETINYPFVLFEENIFDVSLNNRFSTLQMLVFLLMLSSILTVFTMSIILAYERTNIKLN